MKRLPLRAFRLGQRQPSAVYFRSPSHAAARHFHTSKTSFVIKPFLLADIGEGITEVQIIQWFVQPGARVEQFDKLCEVQSDKASVEITSRFDGVIKKLHYEADDMAVVGKPLVDIDIQSEMSEEDEAAATPASEQDGEQQDAKDGEKDAEQSSSKEPDSAAHEQAEQEQPKAAKSDPPSSSSKSQSGSAATLATPAVRRVTKELDVDISEVTGTGKDGRVLKEDVQKFAESRSSAPTEASRAQEAPAREDRSINLSPVQNQMFKTMTRSLNIPHFLYSDSIDMTAITALRRSVNETASSRDDRLSVLPFLVKAVSLALMEYPLLNARVDTTTNPKKPQIVLRAAHNIGIAVDSPQGLLVPVIKSVQDLSVQEIAAEARRLASLARDGKLTSNDMSGGTFSVSNVGSIGGGVVAPVIVESQVAIVGVGKTKVVPAFNEDGDVIRKEECTMSWSADHRVLDGATVARCAERVRSYIEAPETMLVKLK